MDDHGSGSLMSALERLIDRQRRQIARRESPVYRALYRAYGQTVASLASSLTVVTDRIADALDAGEPVSEAWLLRESRYRSLLTQADAQYRRFGGLATDTLVAAATEASAAGAVDATALLRAVGVEVELGNRLSVAATERIVASFAPGSPVARVVSSYGTAARETIERRLIEAVTTGLNPRTVAREIARELNSPMQRARLLVLVRTETMRAHRNAATDRYQANADVLDGVVWHASLSERTCKACLAMSGRRFDVDYQMETHPACRCNLIPVVKGNRVALPPSGDEWLASQPEATQRAVLGPAYDAYAAGDIGLGDFVQRRTDRRWGTSVQERSARDVLRRAA